MSKKYRTTICLPTEMAMNEQVFTIPAKMIMNRAFFLLYEYYGLAVNHFPNHEGYGISEQNNNA